MGLFKQKETGVKLKKLSREELVEIIYALQQSEKTLKEENEKLQRRIDENEQVISHFGTIADASQSLNDIFTEAQKALEQYLMAIRVTASGKELDSGIDVDGGVDVQLAQHRAEEIVAEANRQADEILAEARREVDSALELVRMVDSEYASLAGSNDTDDANGKASADSIDISGGDTDSSDDMGTDTISINGVSFDGVI